MNGQFQSQLAGFSLIEVVMAIAILGVAVVGLTEGLSLALQSNKESELQSTAALFAAGKVETLRAEGAYENGETEGDCGEDLPLYHWKQSITSAGMDGLYEVKVTVENAKTGKAIYEIETLLFQAPDETTSNTSGNRRDTDPRKRRREQ